MGRDSTQSQVIKTLFNEQATKCVNNGKELNEDCWLQIFEGLDYPELLEVAQVNKNFAYFANNVFRRTFADHEFLIFYDASKLNKSAPQNPYEINPGLIRISDFSLILQTLKHFGPLIRKLRLELSDDNSEHLQIIYKYIEDYCTDSLTDLDMENLDILKYTKKPFTRVERFRIRSYLAQLESNQPLLNETFPALREFPLSFRSDNMEPLICYFPHLEHVSVKATFGTDSIEKFLRTNSHIKEADVRMFYPTEFFLKYPSLLPNVDHLTVYDVPYGYPYNEEIRFENVTRLSAMKGFNPKANIFFPKLQLLNMTWISDVTHWSVFLKKHPHLRQINLTYSDRSDEEFNGLLEHSQNLEELFITKVDYPLQYRHPAIEKESIHIETFIAFVENNDKLQLLSLNGYTEDEKKILQKKLELEWTIGYKDNRIVMQRNKINI